MPRFYVEVQEDGLHESDLWFDSVGEFFRSRATEGAYWTLGADNGIREVRPMTPDEMSAQMERFVILGEFDGCRIVDGLMPVNGDSCCWITMEQAP
jgi:hypothetical protein